MTRHLDYQDGDFTTPGIYRVYYQRTSPPAGPFETINAMAVATDLGDYPDDGFIVDFDGEVLGSIPSLNPDDLINVQEVLTKLEREHEELLHRMSRSNAKLAPHLAERAWHKYDQQGQVLQDRMRVLRDQLPPVDEFDYDDDDDA